jgi:hypothetical protein
MQPCYNFQYGAKQFMMDSKLQQAIIAARAGYTETAQLLLTDVLQEDPDETEAWFLLAHLVESPERQARFLDYALALEPDHEMARQHLQRLITPAVPPPVIKESNRQGLSTSHPTPPPDLDSEFSPISPARTDPVITTPAAQDSTYASSQTPSQQVVVEQKSSRIDPEWQRTAGKPKRAAHTAPESVVVPVPRTVATNDAPASNPAAPNRQPANKWLLAILIVMVVLALIVMSFLAYTIFFR